MRASVVDVICGMMALVTIEVHERDKMSCTDPCQLFAGNKFCECVLLPRALLCIHTN